LLRNAAPTFPPQPWLTLSLFLAAAATGWPPTRDGGLAFFILVAMAVLSLRVRLGAAALVILVLVGIELRVVEYGVGFTDVADAIQSGIRDVLNGGNPYAPGLDPLFPGRPPFPYGPLTLLWYLPMRDPMLTEMFVSIGLLAALAIRGRPLGLALWATLPGLVHLAGDGSNDHTPALFLLIALIVAERAPRAGALILGLAAGFKIYLLAWLPPLFVWAGAGALATGIVAFVAVWLPAVLVWGAGPILETFRQADAVHATPYFSLGQVLATYRLGASREALNLFRLAAGAMTAIVASFYSRSYAAVIVAGALIYLVTLYSGYWGTPAYLVPIGLLLCWFIDRWFAPFLRLGNEPDPTRIRWPGDPVGRLMAAVDRRWPARD
jgi:hypothetical protein